MWGGRERERVRGTEIKREDWRPVRRQTPPHTHRHRHKNTATHTHTASPCARALGVCTIGRDRLRARPSGTARRPGCGQPACGSGPASRGDPASGPTSGPAVGAARLPGLHRAGPAASCAPSPFHGRTSARARLRSQTHPPFFKPTTPHRFFWKKAGGRGCCGGRKGAGDQNEGSVGRGGGKRKKGWGDRGRAGGGGAMVEHSENVFFGSFSEFVLEGFLIEHPRKKSSCCARTGAGAGSGPVSGPEPAAAGCPGRRIPPRPNDPFSS